VAGGLQAVELVQFGDVLDVELLEQPRDAVLAADALLDQAEPRAHQIPGAPHLRADHVSLGDDVGIEKHGEHIGVDLVGFDLGRRDCLEPGGVGEGQVYAVVLQ
jgi:hypothetical protein